MSSRRRKLEHKKIMDNWDANGKPLKPKLGKDLGPGTWVTRDCLIAYFAYYVLGEPVCDENGFAKEVTIIRPNCKMDFLCERNKPTRTVYEFESYEDCKGAYENGEERETRVLHEDKGWYRDGFSTDDYWFGVCREDQSGL